MLCVVMKGVFMNLRIKRKLIVVEASLWRRVAAFFIDYIIINGLILFPFNRLIERMFKVDNIMNIFSMVSDSNFDLTPLIYISLMMGIISLFYFSIIEFKFNQSIGKIIMNIYVVNTNKKLTYKGIPKMTFFQSLIRSLPLIFFFIFPLVIFFDIVSVLFNKDRLRFMEKVSKTKTITFGLI
jgi:uncharacterized RDD family membrane protein YckC